MIDEVSENKAKIIELLSNAYGYDTLLAAMKECHMLLRKTAHLIETDEFQHGWNPKLQNISDLMECLLCNGHYPHASEYSRGISYEPVVNEGKVFLCWECCHALKQKLDGQYNSMAYSFLFSLGKETIELRKRYAVQETQKTTLQVALARSANNKARGYSIDGREVIVQERHDSSHHSWLHCWRIESDTNVVRTTEIDMTPEEGYSYRLRKMFDIEPVDSIWSAM